MVYNLDSILYYTLTIPHINVSETSVPSKTYVRHKPISHSNNVINCRDTIKSLITINFFGEKQSRFVEKIANIWVDENDILVVLKKLSIQRICL